MHHPVKPFLSTDANSKSDARHGSHSCRGRVGIELCVPAAGRRGLPHPDDSTPVFPSSISFIAHKATNARAQVYHIFIYLLHGQ